MVLAFRWIASLHQSHGWCLTHKKIYPSSVVFSKFLLHVIIYFATLHLIKTSVIPFELFIRIKATNMQQRSVRWFGHSQADKAYNENRWPSPRHTQSNLKIAFLEWHLFLNPSQFIQNGTVLIPESSIGSDNRGRRLVWWPIRHWGKQVITDRPKWYNTWCSFKGFRVCNDHMHYSVSRGIGEKLKKIILRSVWNSNLANQFRQMKDNSKSIKNQGNKCDNKLPHPITSG